MAQTQHNTGFAESAMTTAGDVTKGTFNFARGTFEFLKNTTSYTLSLFNRDGGVGAALGLAAGTAAAIFAAPLAGVLGVVGITGLSATAATCAVGACAGGIAGGHLGKNRVEKEKLHGKQIKQPSMLNKNTVMGFGLGATAQMAALGAAGVATGATGGLVAAAAIAGSSLLPLAGAYYGGQMGAQRMMKDAVAANNAQMQALTKDKGRSKSRSPRKEHAHDAQQHGAHRSFKDSVSKEEWGEASSLMRDSNNNRGEGGHAAKILADRAAAREMAQQPSAEA